MNSQGSILVYIVDDDKMYSEMLKHSIEHSCKEFELHVELFIVGETFLRSLDKKPDLVILDYFLNTKFAEAIDGLEVLKRIKEASPHTKVVMLTTLDDSKIADKAMENGAYDYVTKDKAAFERIRELVNETCEKRHSFFKRMAGFFKSSGRNLAVLESR